MAATYDFRILINRAKFGKELIITTPYAKDSLLHQENFEGTMKDAIARRAAISQQFSAEPHEASLSMKYSNDRKAPGIQKVRYIYNNPEDHKPASQAAPAAQASLF